MIKYLLLINAAALLFMCADKIFARLHARRIPEAVLLGTAVLGGSVGALLGMLVFRHKTRKPKFFVTLPLLAVAQVLLFLYFWAKG